MKQHVFKLHTYDTYISNTSKRANTFFKSLRGSIFLDQAISCIFFEQRKLNSYKTSINALD